jgi:hypothetical protein
MACFFYLLLLNFDFSGVFPKDCNNILQITLTKEIKVDK